MDISKQISSAIIAHFLNLVFSFFLHNEKNSNDCVWYFVSYVIDTLISIPLCVFMMEYSNYTFHKKGKHVG